MKITATFIILLIMIKTNSQTNRSITEANGISVGEIAPIFKAIDADSIEFSLEKTLKSGPVVLIFYRGFWCPYCNKHLSQVQDSLQLIMEKGATVVAVSPEKPGYLDKMAKKSGAKFKLLYDEGCKIADAFDVTFTPKKTELFAYNTFLNAGLKKNHSDDSQRLPIPATYIINKEGTIVWKQLDPDYKKRSTVKEIVEQLSMLK